jgi:hypothetical protein
VIGDWPEEFDRWFTNVEKQGGRLLATTVALLQALTDLPAKPTEESATFKRSGKPAATNSGESPIRSTRILPSG